MDRALDLEAERLGVTVTDAEVAALMEHRYAGQDDLEARLDEHGLTLADLERETRGELVSDALRHWAVGGAVDPREAQHRLVTFTDAFHERYRQLLGDLGGSA